MIRVYLLRHGETAMNADGNRYCGRSDVALNERGLQQAQVMAERLQSISFDAVYASPLQRASRTAEIASGGREIRQDSRLIEVDFGSWEGKTRPEFIAEDPDLWNQWNTDPGHTKAGGTGEDALTVVERVGAFFKEMEQRHADGHLLVVGHNGINRLYMAHMLGMPLRNYRRIFQDNASITELVLNDQEPFQLRQLNCK